MSAKSPSNISLIPSELIDKVSELSDSFFKKVQGNLIVLLLRNPCIISKRYLPSFW
jgi:hypothetical protein